MVNPHLAPPTYMPNSSARGKFFARYSGEVSREDVEPDDEAIDSMFSDVRVLEDLVSLNSEPF